MASDYNLQRIFKKTGSSGQKMRFVMDLKKIHLSDTVLPESVEHLKNVQTSFGPIYNRSS